MKAIVVTEFGGPEVLQLVEVETPKPGPSQVLVKVHAAGVNPVDTYLRSGNHAHAPKLPYTPGKDAAGVVEAVGENVNGWTPGDRVYTSNSATGTYAEYTVCGEDQLGRLPRNVSFEKGAGVWTPYATSYRALFQRAAAKSGETVLIHGASGGVGIAAMQWAKNSGLTVLGTAGSSRGLELVKEQGADNVFDHTAEGYLEQVRGAAGGKGPDIIVEMLANVNLQRDLDIIAMFGRIVVIGNRGSLDFNPRAIMGKDATIYGMSLFNAPKDAFDEIYPAIYKGLEAGFLDPVIRDSIRLAEAPESHRAVIEERAGGKIVLLP